MFGGLTAFSALLYRRKYDDYQQYINCFIKFEERMIFRAALLSFALLTGIGLLVPLATDYTEAGAVSHKNLKKRYKKYRKYSKQRWRAYHNRARQRKNSAARKRLMRLRQIRFANSSAGSPMQPTAQNIAGSIPNIQTDNLFILVEGKIKKVYDGDTVSLETRDGKAYTIRMLGADAPELSEYFGDKSQKKLSDLVLGKDATVIIRKKDASERYIGTVYSSGQDINLRQIETGMASYLQQNGYEPKGDDRRLYEQAEQKARIEKNGLWRNQKSVSAFRFQAR
jgi:endonuclease YncB( thermonuclease family)